MSSEPLADFKPLWWASGPVAQTALAQLRFRTWGRNEMRARARTEVLRLSGGITVEGSFSAQIGRDPKGLVIMLSGWEGHANSSYLLRTGRALYREGYEIFRLTYPDHGETHDLNEAAFHFGMLDKIGEAIHRTASSIRTRPVYVVGFSMGGNLALNLACRGMPGLKAVFAVSPAMDFGRAIGALQKSSFHRFFLSRWKTSLGRKQALFPRRHDFTDLQNASSVTEIAGDLLSAQGETRTFEDYTARYSLTPAKLRKLTVPAHLLTSLDDPIVGPTNYADYDGIDRLSLYVLRQGGHVGFLGSLFGASYYETLLSRLLREYESRPLVEHRDDAAVTGQTARLRI